MARRKGQFAGFTLALCLANFTNASNPEYIESDSIDSEVEAASPLDYSFQQPVVLKKYRQRLDERSRFVSDSRLDANIRSYSFWRDNNNAHNYETSALGGELHYLSGWHKDWFQLESSLYTSQKVYGPEDRDGSGLLQTGQQGYTVLGKLNAKIRYRNHTLSLYRSELNTPFANQKDIRMTPLMFENYSLSSTLNDNVDILAAAVTQYKALNDDDFEPMLHRVDKENDDALYMLGARYRLSETFTGGAIIYHLEDYLNIAYAEYKWIHQWGRHQIDLSQQYIQQQSRGQEVGGEINNHAWGLKLDYIREKWEWTLAWHDVSGDRMRKDWGSYPGYNSMIVRDFDRADETSWRLGVRYDLASVLTGLSVFGSYIDGDTPDRGDRRSTDETELDVTFNYAVQNRYFKDVNIRLRYAKVTQDYKEGAGSLEDLRFIINYKLPLF